MKTSGNTILITGGGSGIGRGLAEAFQKLGNKVIIAGRRQSTLDEVTRANPGMMSAALDVEDAVGIETFGAKMAAEHPSLNVLINNAGMMRFETVLDGKDHLADAEATIATNLLGPIRLTTALLPHLRKQPDAAIVNVSSGLAFVPLAITPTYSATKAAMHSYTVSLRYQLAQAGVEVIEVIPPAVQTDLTPGQSTRPAYMPLGEYIRETMSLFQQQPTPKEIRVQRVEFLRQAEAEGRFDTTFDTLNPVTALNSDAGRRAPDPALGSLHS